MFLRLGLGAGQPRWATVKWCFPRESWSGLRLQVLARNSIERTNGRGGIRTHGTLLTYTHFPGVRLKPLGHPSQHRFQARTIGIPLCNACQRKPRTEYGLRTTADCGQLRTADNSVPCGVPRDTKRTGRDSNSRYRVHRYAGFRDRCLQPLGHLSCSLANYRGAEPSSTLWRLKKSSRSAAHSAARTPALTSGR
jgi:hypothetical protein